MKKIITVVGARPQFIKAAAVSRIIRNTSSIQEILVHTGQHFDENMSEVFFREMEIPRPDYHLEINSLSHGAMTGRMLEGIEKVIIKEEPDLVMVYGDTNSTLAGALAAKKLNINVAHVEAGLRSFNMDMPEEVNRILTDRISGLLFCPTETAVSNLEKEGFSQFKCSILKTGDVMYDAALFYGSKSSDYPGMTGQLNLQKDEFIICTIHRQENTDDINNLKSIIEALNRLNKTIRVILPLHPRTRKIMETNNIKAGFTLLEPLGYFEIIGLLKNCRMVITDSGGMQKEAFFFEKFCLTVRNETEWTELVENGYNFLTGANVERILEGFDKILSSKFINRHHFYGKGDAAQKIVKAIS